MQNKFYLTTPIYYVNARPHIGHAYTTLVADAIARRKRALGIDTWFLTGTDEHGQKVQRSAENAGIPPQAFTDEVSAQFRGLWDRMGLTYDDYIRTTEERHKRGVLKLFTVLQERGYIYKGFYTGQYSVGEEMFVEGPPGTIGPDGKPTETVTEENYFFKLSAFERTLLDVIWTPDPSDPASYSDEAKQGKLVIQPDSARKEVLSFIRSGLKDLSVSRTSFSWGIPVPGDEKHVIYVWLDALANYITAIGYGSDDPAEQKKFEKFWPADLHLIGKEISRFHCVYWPAFLIAAGLPLPKSIVANGWLLFEESKMSKSRGNVVRTETILGVLGADALRYFLLREIVFGQDGSFSFDALVQRYNSDLANGYGNLVSRTLTMIGKYFDGVVPEGDFEEVSALRLVLSEQFVSFARHFDNLNFTDALRELWDVIGKIDNYLTSNAPWKQPESVTDEQQRAFRATVLYTAAEAIRIITALVYPIIPDAAARVWSQIGLGDIQQADLKNLAWGGLKPGTQLGELGPVFPRAEKDAITHMHELEQKRAAASASVSADSTAATPEASHPSKPHTSRLESVIDGLATAISESTSESAAAVAIENFIRDNVGSGKDPEARTPAVDPPSQPSAPVSTAAAPVPSSEKITIDDFAKIDLRVAQIKVAERVPKADKLLRLEVDLGYEQRQILAGIAEAYTPESLIGRKVVIVANLAPRKLRGLESNGMIVAASLEGGKPVLAGFLEEIEVGARLK